MSKKVKPWDKSINRENQEQWVLHELARASSPPTNKHSGIRAALEWDVREQDWRFILAADDGDNVITLSWVSRERAFRNLDHWLAGTPEFAHSLAVLDEMAEVLEHIYRFVTA